MESFDFEKATFNHGETLATFYYLTLGDDDVPEHVTNCVHDVMKRRTPKSEIVKQVGPFERNKFYHLKFKQRNIKNRTEFLKERYGDDPEALEKIKNNVSDAKFLPFALDWVYYLWSHEEWKASVWQDLVVRYTVYALLHFTSVELEYKDKYKHEDEERVVPKLLACCRHTCTFEPFRDGKKTMVFDPLRIYPKHTFGYEKTSTMTDVLMGQKEEDSSLMVVVKATLPVKMGRIQDKNYPGIPWTKFSREELAKEMLYDSWEARKRLKMHVGDKFHEPRVSEEFRKNAKGEDRETFKIFPKALTADTMDLTKFAYEEKVGPYPASESLTDRLARQVYKSAPMYFLLNRKHVGQLCDMLTETLLEPVLKTLPTPGELFDQLFRRTPSEDHVGFVLAKEITLPLFFWEFPDLFKTEREEYNEHMGEIWTAEEQHSCTKGPRRQPLLQSWFVKQNIHQFPNRYTKQPGMFMGKLKKRQRLSMEERRELEKQEKETLAKVTAFAATQGLSVEDLEAAFKE